MGTTADPLREPLSDGDLSILTYALPALLMGILVYIVSAQWNHRPLTDWDATPVHPVAFQLDVNQAGWTELSQLPGIGATLAKRIVDHRNQHGRFERFGDLCNVRGIGEKSLARIAPFIAPLEIATVSSPNLVEEE